MKVTCILIHMWIKDSPQPSLMEKGQDLRMKEMELSVVAHTCNPNP